MSTQRRYIQAGCLYEICFRAKEGLPLPPKQVINLLITSAIARAQRDHKVHLCHYLWMSNHPHLYLIARDADQCKNFYGEVQKKLTESIKRLLGESQMNIWEGTANVAHIGDLDEAVREIAYAFANPATANLVDTIEDYPGLNTFALTNNDELTFQHKQKACWVRDRTVKPLQGPCLSERQDMLLTKQLKEANKKRPHELVLEPNLWMQCFGITSNEDIRKVNQRIHRQLWQLEEKARELRLLEGKSIVGRSKLLSEPIMKPHTPKKKERKVFVLCSVKELRISLIQQYKEFCAICRERYSEWKQSNFDNPWPPGAFRPPLPVQANAWG